MPPELARLGHGVRDADARLWRSVAFTFLGTVAILALYFGREVLIPTALAILFAFMLGPIVTWVRRLLPLPVSVTLVVIGAVISGGLLAVLVLTQLADVAGSLTSYQANLHQKIQDVKALSKDGAFTSWIF